MKGRRGMGGAERDRTAGLLVANEALSQLSYSPTPIDFYILPVFPFARHSPTRRRIPAESDHFPAGPARPSPPYSRPGPIRVRAGQGTTFVPDW